MYSYKNHGGIFRAPANAVTAVIMLGVQANTTCLFDDISLSLVTDVNYGIPVNGGFENNLYRWNSKYGSVTISNYSYGGTKACKASGGTSGAGINSAQFKVYQGRRYRLHSQVKQLAGGGRYKVTIAWKNAAGKVIRYHNDWKGTNHPAVYTKHGGVFRAPEGAKNAVIMLGVNSHTTCLFDSIGLELLDESYEIWVTPDFRYDNNDFFVPNAAWARARRVTEVFKFHIREFNDNDPMRNWIMNVNQMVTYLNTYGIKIGLEAAGTSGGANCTAPKGTGYQSAKGQLGPINRIYNASGPVSYLMLDGPISRTIKGGRKEGDGGAHGECGFTLQKSVNELVKYMQTIHDQYPKIKIGLGVNFDHWDFKGYANYFGSEVHNYTHGSGYSYNQVLNAILPAVAMAGEKIHFIIVDNPYEPYYKETRAPSNNEALDNVGRLLALQGYCAARGIKLGMMYNTADGSSDLNFYQETMAQLADHEKNGIQFTIINPESWYENMPINYLPDTGAYTFMKLVFDMSKKLKVDRN